VSKITRADVADYYRSWFNPANSEIVIVGDIGQAEAEAALTGTLGRWSNAGSQATVVSVPAQVVAPGIYLIDRPGMEQADLTVATLLDAPASPANPINAVMTNILGDSTSGRINLDLREQKQWAFWAIGYVEGGHAGQMLLIRTQVQSQRTAEAIAEIKGHLEGVKGSKPIAPDELQYAKDMLTLSLPLGWETDEGIGNAIATSVRRGLPDVAIEKFVTDVRAVTKEQVEQAAHQILRPDAMVWLVIGVILTGGFRPAGHVLDALRRAGIFSYLVGTDTYRTAQAVDEILVKTHASDTEKIATIIDLVSGSLDVDALLARL
jgi:zinc protease